MKVLLWHWGRRGGGARYTLELARALAPQCTLAVSLSRQSELFAQTALLGLPGFHVDTYHDRLSAVLALTTIPRLRRQFGAYLAQERFDAIIATMHHIWCPAFLGPIRKSGAKLIFAVHDAEPHPGDPDFAWHAMLAREIAASDGLVALSAHVARRLRARFVIGEDRLWIIPHPPFGFAGTHAAPRAFPKGRPFRLSFFGRIKAYKGLGLLLDAVRSLQTQHPITLCIAGHGSLAPYAAQLQHLRDVQILNHWIAEAEVPQILEASDLIVAPYTEASQSGVIPSAYGVGLPVIATPVGGLTEQVRPGETGLLARAPTAEALADAIARMITDPALYERCSVGALEEAGGTLSWAGVASAYLSAVHTLTRRGAVGRSETENGGVEAK